MYRYLTISQTFSRALHLTNIYRCSGCYILHLLWFTHHFIISLVQLFLAFRLLVIGVHPFVLTFSQSLKHSGTASFHLIFVILIRTLARCFNQWYFLFLNFLYWLYCKIKLAYWLLVEFPRYSIWICPTIFRLSFVIERIKVG